MDILDVKIFPVLLVKNTETTKHLYVDLTEKYKHCGSVAQHKKNIYLTISTSLTATAAISIKFV